MKRSYLIIFGLAAVLALGIGGLFAYGINSGMFGFNVSDTGISSGADIDESAEKDGADSESADNTDDNEGIVPFSSIAEKDGVIYTTESMAKAASFDDAEIIPIDSELFAIIGEDVYYVTPGDDEYAPELRRCGTDGNTDVAVTEFVSPLGSPAFVNGCIYSAYYTDKDEGMNNGIYCYDISEGTTVKAIDGEYSIYGYDDDSIYFSDNSDSTGTTIQKMDYNGENKSDVLNYSTKADSVVIYGDYLFFTAYSDTSHCYKIYRSPKDGNGNIDEYAFECSSGYFDVIDDRVYYQAAGGVYSSKINGSNENHLTDMGDSTQYAYGFLKFGDIMWYREHYSGGDRIYRLDMSSGENVNITK